MVLPLTDLYRRSPRYMVTLYELMINDKDLQEAWYNLGRYQLSDASVSPSVGFCGSEYPLYLTGIIPFLFKLMRDHVKSISYCIHSDFSVIL